MTTEQLIFIYFPLSILFLIVMSILFYRYRQRKEAEFKKFFPVLLEEIKIGDLQKANQTLDKIQWNNLMGFKPYLIVKSELDNLNYSNSETELIRDKINEVFETKGWNAIPIK